MDRLYFGGPIVTLEPEGRAEALLVRGDRIAAVGKLDALRALAPHAEPIDLDGRALLPAFIDAHSHLSGTANAFLQAPLDEETTFEGVKNRIERFIRDNAVPPGKWVVGKGYDHNALAEKAHPTLALLDAAAPDNPLVVQHQSGHMGVFNSRALALLGVAPDTPAPDGGRIGVEDGRLTGYMEEAAFVQYQKRLPMPDLDALLDAYGLAQKQYAAHGIVTVQEGMLPGQLLPIYQRLLERNLLTLDVIGYPDPASFDEAAALFPADGAYDRNFRIGGMKIFLDGSPQGRTAWMRAPYADDPAYCGYGTMTDAAVRQALLLAARRGVQLLAHCNGDAAAEQFLSSVRETAKTEPSLTSLRLVLIHAQLLGADQLDAVRALGVIPSFFVAHVYHWGDVHLKNFGPARAAAISPAESALRAGIRFTFHQDTPVIEPDMLETIWCACCRRTRTGKTLGPEQAVDPLTALSAVTINAAYQYGEESHRGSLSAGKRADLVLLSDNPLAAPPEQIRRIRVEETIRAGKTVFRR